MPLCGVLATGAGLVMLGATENLAVPCLPELASGVLSPLSAREAAAEEAEELLQSREDSERLPRRVVFGSVEGRHRAQPVCAYRKGRLPASSARPALPQCRGTVAGVAATVRGPCSQGVWGGDPGWGPGAHQSRSITPLLSWAGERK